MFTDSIVLKTWPYSETTLIVSLLTREHGVAKVLAKGARKLKGGSAGALEFASMGRASLRLRSGEGLGILASIDLKEPWMYLRRDLERFALAALGLEVIGAVAADSPREPFYFEEAERFLRALESAPAPGSLACLLMIRLLVHAGHPPQIADDLDPARLPEKMAFDFSENAFVARDAPGAASRRFPLTGSLVAKLAAQLSAPPDFSEAPPLPRKEGALALRWLVKVWEDHANQEFRSAEFLEKTLLKGA